jgi:hypothetical protein
MMMNGMVNEVVFAGIARGRAIASRVGMPEPGKAYRTLSCGRVMVTDFQKAQLVMLDAARRATSSRRHLPASQSIPHDSLPNVDSDRAKAAFERGVLEGISEAVSERILQGYGRGTRAFSTAETVPPQDNRAAFWQACTERALRLSLPTTH